MNFQSIVVVILSIYCQWTISSHITCYRCTFLEAFTADNQTGSLLGCDDPSILSKHVHCKTMCMQHIFRNNKYEIMPSEPGSDVMIYVTRYPGDARLRDCAPPSTQSGKCILDPSGNFYECYCSQKMCNGMAPPCSWLREANPEDSNPAGCVEDEDDGMGGYRDDLRQTSVSCHQCSSTDSFYQKDGVQANLEGCDQSEIHKQSEQCPVVCKQQILRQQMTQNATLAGKSVSVTRDVGDVYMQGCGEGGNIAGTCRMIGTWMYECYCGQNMCNGKPPPCSWIRKVNPDDKSPYGCVEDEERYGTTGTVRLNSGTPSNSNQAKGNGTSRSGVKSEVRSFIGTMREMRNSMSEIKTDVSAIRKGVNDENGGKNTPK